MGVRGAVRTLVYGAPSQRMWGAEFVAARKLTATLDEATEVLFGRTSTLAPAATWRLPTVRQALGVPSIHRAVALISSTTGMLSMQGFRNGSVMDSPPPLISRPDPYQTPQAFYSTSAAQMAKYGEIVWFIASTDTDGLASALVNVPLYELRVDPNPDDRLRPRYQWGSVRSTRWSPATPEGRFVHIKYPLAEPYALRGEGPLQLCNAAASVSVEAQMWAAQFFAEGGDPSTVIKHAGYLGTDVDADGYTEADRLRNQWVNKPHNVPRIVDQNIESIEYKQPSESGAQMLQAREHQNGDAARMFGLPGKFVEYVQSGTSLTYQTLESAFEDLVKTCLAPLYLEPIEQALSDLLTRSTVARFNIKGFLRADIKTRFDVYNIGIPLGIITKEKAMQEEGYAPGDVEFAPVPYSPPSAVPNSVPRLASLSAELRDVRCPSCKRLIIRAAGPVEGVCRHCKTPVAA